jgi:hypothetical protein
MVAMTNVVSCIVSRQLIHWTGHCGLQSVDTRRDDGPRVCSQAEHQTDNRDANAVRLGPWPEKALNGERGNHEKRRRVANQVQTCQDRAEELSGQNATGRWILRLENTKSDGCDH